jgi:hypothetical protein
MAGMLSAFIPDWKEPKDVSEFNDIMARTATYHTGKCSDNQVKEAFFKWFNENHFKYERK